MPEHQQIQQSKKSDTIFQKRTTPTKQIPLSNPMAIIQRAKINPQSLTHSDVMQLQRTIGNRAVGRLLSDIGLVPSTAIPVQRQETTDEEKKACPSCMQRQEIPEEEEPLQGKMIRIVQRQEIPEEEEPLQGKMIETIQRQEIPEEEEPLQGKMVETVQRQEIPEEEEPLQGKFVSKPEMACPSCFVAPIAQRQEIPEEEEPIQGKMIEPIQRQEIPEEEEPLQTKRENNTGMPDNLKAGVESLSGIDMSDVRVHYNSDKPADVGALAYTQGTNIHVAPGQERHLPHEAWHVVQQAQGRVKPTMQLKDGVLVNDDQGLECEADVMGSKLPLKTGQDVFLRQGEYEPGSRERKELIAHKLTQMVQKQKVIQRYTLYQPGAALGQYQTQGGADFTSQVKGADNSFLDPISRSPRLVTQAAPAVRISQNGQLAIEDAQLTGRQPKFFYADANMVPVWNDTLLAQGSFYELVEIAGPTLHFVMPAGGAHTLAKIEARNRIQGNQGLNMTTAQQCDVTVQEVLGTIGKEPKALFRNAPMPLPANNPATQEIIRHYYVAAELAYEAAGGGIAGGGGAWGVGGMPVNGVDFGNQGPAFNTVAANYGNAMHAHLGGAHNAALNARMQHLGVNEYVAPEVGQGLVTHKLGDKIAGQLNDPYNNRVVPNPNNNTMWGFHWAGVIAKDGADYITLENYARNAEDNHLPLSPADPRFYFQMYGAAAQSWHVQWSAIGHGGREFVNPVSMVVSAEETPAVYEERARRNFGNNIHAIRDDHHTLAVALTNDQLKIGLLKGLAYAKDILDNNAWGNWTRVNAWKTAVTSVANPNVAVLRDHVLTCLNEIWVIPVIGR